MITRNAQQLGNAIRTARREKGLSQADLAEKTGLRQATISKIETGNGATKLETVLKVMAMLRLNMKVMSINSANIEDVL